MRTVNGKPRPQRISLTLRPHQLVLVNRLVHTHLGESRSEVLRTMVTQWMTDHWPKLSKPASTDVGGR
jgi:hypothetical protein